MASTSLIKALGLDISTNALEAPSGSLLEASNVIIRRDDVVESRRGYDLYGTPFGTSTDRCKQMAEYKNKIIRHYSNKLQFEYETNNSGKMEFLDFNGDYSEAVPGRRFRSIESTGNFYFTSSNGIKKISAKTASEFSTSSDYITNAGGINAVDIEADLDLVQGQTGGFLPQDSVVSYKVVWGIKDANNVLVLGAPSDYVTVYNALSNSLVLDLNKVLNSLDNIDQTGSMITDGNYVSSLSLNTSASALQIKNNLVSLTEKIDKDIVYVDGSVGPLKIDSINVSSGVVTLLFKDAEITNIPVSPFITATYIYPTTNSGIASITSGGGAPNSLVTFSATNSFSSGDTVRIGDTSSATTPSIAGTYTIVSATAISFDVYVPQTFSFTPFTYFNYYIPPFLCELLVANTYSTGDSIIIKDSNTTPSIDGTYSIVGATATQIFIHINNPLESVSSPTAKIFKNSSVSTTLTSPNNYSAGDSVIIYNTTSTPTINGTYTVLSATPTQFEITTPTSILSSGTGTSIKSTNLVTDYFSSGQKISLSNFKSNLTTGYDIVEINKEQTVVNPTSYSLQFTPSAYSSSNPAGITGVGSTEGSSFTTSPFSLVVSSSNHGLTSGQKIKASGSTSSISVGAGITSLNNTFEATVLNNSSFSIDLPFTAVSKTFTASSGSVKFLVASGHDFIADTPVTLSTDDTLPPPLLPNVTYYIKNPTTVDFELTETLGGNSITATGSGSGNNTANKKFTVSSGTLNWSISVDNISTAKIESNTFRAIEKPEDPSSPANNAELVVLKNYLQSIISALQLTKNSVISSPLKALYIDNLKQTENSNVNLTINIPSGIKENDGHFYQIYRSKIITATSVDVLSDFPPNQEYILIEENFPATLDYTNKYVKFLDDIPETTAVTGSYLYTNERTGEGALQANSPPPFATDINTFKNCIFYSNTRLKQKKTLNLLPTDSVWNSYNPLNKPKIIFSCGTSALQNEVYTFVKGEQQTTTVVCGLASSLAAAGNADYFLINTPNDDKKYYVWYSVVPGSMVDPAPSGVPYGIKVVVNATDTADLVAEKTKNAINSLTLDFSSVIGPSNTVVIQNFDYGKATAASDGGTGFSISTVFGAGEDIQTRSVLLSNGGGSTSLAIEETAKSLIKVINRSSQFLNASYISTSTLGTMLFEAVSLDTPEFYILASDVATGETFNPYISPSTNSITSVSGSPAVIQTTTSHGLNIGDKIILFNFSTSPEDVNGQQIVTEIVSSTQFKIDKDVSSTTSLGAWNSTALMEVSENESQKHRVYYSKYQQAEAVPILNYIDVGANDKEVLRIFPLRDTLFVFKEDGLFRISGESAPFSLSLFDSSCILLAPDSLDVSNNQLYCWTTQGISVVTEAGVNIISRPIDVEVLRIATHPNFKTATWGVGYESDTSYTVYTVKNYSDAAATIGYRYSSLTNSWTSIDKDYVCGINKNADDRLYLAPNDLNYIERERKDFSRYDYSDRELKYNITSGSYNNKVINLNSVAGISVGDVLVQTQTVSVYEFNSLLKKIDSDPGVPSSNYYETLYASKGQNLRTKLEQLATKLDSDSLGFTNYLDSIDFYSKTISSVSPTNPAVVTTTTPHNLLSNRYVQILNVSGQPKVNGVFSITPINSTSFSIPVNSNILGVGGPTATVTTLTETFEDMKACFNIICSKLNDDTVVVYNNYSPITNNTPQETVIIEVNKILNTIKVNIDLDLIIGEFSVFQAIPCSIVYNPNLMGDPLGFKHIREATMMFINKAFTSASLKFSTDLLPEFIEVPFNGDGSGIFGDSQFGSGFFGGASNSAPFRTFIPRQCQRCRYINVGFEHRVAREQFGIYGLTLTGETGISTRAYR